MGKKKSWFAYVKRLLISEPKPKSEKKLKNSKSFFKSKHYPAIEAPKKTLNDAAEEERRKHAVAIATAAAAAAEAAIAAAKAAAEVARLTNLSRELRRKNLHSAATKIQTCYKGYLARKALSALKGVVKLQAVVRGELVRRHVIKKLTLISLLFSYQFKIFIYILISRASKMFISRVVIFFQWELRLQRSRITQEKKTPAAIGSTNLAQLKLRNAIKHAKDEVLASHFFTSRRRSFCLVNDKTARGDDDYDDKILHKAQIFPAYMAATESPKAKTKMKSSTPKQRRRQPDSYSCQDSPSKLSISSWSSFNSELIKHNERSMISNLD